MKKKIFGEVRKVTQELMYRFDGPGEMLQSHRLAFYPSPSYEIYQNDADLYDADYIYGDILNNL